MEQMGNIGSEVDRAISWKQKKKEELSTNAFHRSLELLDLTIGDPRWRGPKLKELTRVRELLCDVFVGENEYEIPSEFFSKYFFAFALAARRKQEKK
jgi:hypothetical protein